MLRGSLSGLTKQRLRRALLIFFLALAIPTAILVFQAYGQLKWEAFHQNRLLAEELAKRIDNRLAELLYQEESRSFDDYSFLIVKGDPAAKFVQRSPLSNYPVSSAIPGLIGYFQVDAGGVLSTPFLPQSSVEQFPLPETYGLSPQQIQQRLALQSQIQQILSENRLVYSIKSKIGSGVAQRRAPAPSISSSEDLADAEVSINRQVTNEPAREADASSIVEEQLASQAAFDQLKSSEKDADQMKKQEATGNLGRVEDLKLEKRFKEDMTEKKSQQAILAKSAPSQQQRSARKERSVSLEAPAVDETTERSIGPLRIRTFESDIDPFEFSLLDSGHFVLFRKVWRDGQRYIQGLLIEQGTLVQGIVDAEFRSAAIAQMSNLIVAYQGNVISMLNGRSSGDYLSRAAELRGELLYLSRLSAPLSDLELIFSITRLPAGPGAVVIYWLAAALAVILCGGFYLLYRLGLRQIELTRQQQDFVSAVSHELKTPLTSIRMYGEMLRAGWANDEKKAEYYDYIYNESERLSRLINNVLQLARMTRNELQVNLKTVGSEELMDMIRSKVASQIEQAGYSFKLQCDQDVAQARVLVDVDYFTQIIINLVDNSIKFSSKASTKAIDIHCRLESNNVVFAVRDYGPGVGKDQMKKIFKLFYRSENELTRETVGTGIGLALVQQLAEAMKARVDVINRDPGAEFRLLLTAR